MNSPTRLSLGHDPAPFHLHADLLGKQCLLAPAMDCVPGVVQHASSASHRVVLRAAQRDEAKTKPVLGVESGWDRGASEVFDSKICAPDRRQELPISPAGTARFAFVTYFL